MAKSLAAAPFTLNWGIMATGHIAKRFAKDLLTDPLVRNTSDVCHRIVAVASSTSKEKAEGFCVEVDAPPGEVTAYSSYRELVADPAIDIVYIATPVSHHFPNAMLALEAGKHVLCEKTLTITSLQTEKLISTARAKGLFLMEAVWIRFFPLSKQVRDMVSSGAIGTVHRVIADASVNKGLENGELSLEDSHRMINPKLGGGAMLDLGIYSLTWIMQILYHLQTGEEKEKPHVVAAVDKYRTGVDDMTSFLVHFPQRKTMGIGMAGLRVAAGGDAEFTGGPAIRIQGSVGEIQVLGPAFKPHAYRIIRADGSAMVETVDCPFPKDPKRDGWGHGMYWEADECARCIRDGKTESDVLPLEESLVLSEVMNSVLRQGGVEYPEHITSDIYNT
ncbi:D-xylose 1-dehydrogenase (NADP(+)) [Apiospora arundinis]